MWEWLGAGAEEFPGNAPDNVQHLKEILQHHQELTLHHQKQVGKMYWTQEHLIHRLESKLTNPLWSAFQGHNKINHIYQQTKKWSLMSQHKQMDPGPQHLIGLVLLLHPTRDWSLMNQQINLASNT